MKELREMGIIGLFLICVAVAGVIVWPVRKELRISNQQITHNEQYITALQSQVESLTDRVEQLEGRE